MSHQCHYELKSNKYYPSADQRPNRWTVLTGVMHNLSADDPRKLNIAHRDGLPDRVFPSVQ